MRPRGVIGDCRRDEFRLLGSRRRGPAPGPPTPRTVQSGRPACTSRGLLHRSRVRPRGVIGDCRRDEFRLLVSRRRGPAPGPPAPRTVQSGRPACTSRGLLHRSRVAPRGVIGDCRRDEFRLLGSRRRGPAPGPPTPRTVQSGRPACTSRGLLHRSRVAPRGVMDDFRRNEFRLLPETHCARSGPSFRNTNLWYRSETSRSDTANPTKDATR